MKIILGSASPRRRKLLSDWGYAFDVLNPNVDERAIRTEVSHELPLVLAKAKNKALMPMAKNAILITSDSVVIHNGQLREKPKDTEELRHFLSTYWEAPAEVITAVVVSNTMNGKTLEGVESAKVYFHKFPDKLIEELISHGNLMGVSGGFIAEMPAMKKYIVYMEGGMDTIMGLPKELTKRLIQEVQQ